MELSIVTTLYESSPHLSEFHARMTRAAQELTDDYEIVFVNDGSPDDSLSVALEIFADDERVRVIDFSRNFGHHKAMMTGLAHARGSHVFLIDCDLEEDPALLATFDAKMRESGADVVFGVQGERAGGFVERLSAKLFYRIFGWLSPDPMPENVLTVRLMTRRYVDALTAHQERQTVIAGLWASTGFDQQPIVVQKSRKATTTYTFPRKVAHLVNAITSFSDRPLIVVFYAGAVIMALSMMAALYLVVRRLFFGTMLAGWPSLMVSMWFLGGLTVFCLGLIGVYLSRVFIETKRRPYTIVRQIYEHPQKGVLVPEAREHGIREPSTTRR